MKDRIKKIRKELDLTQQKFADRLGVKRNTVAQWETGVNSLTDAVITSICREFNINEEWLRSGKGEIFNELDIEDQLMEWAGKVLSGQDSGFKKRFVTMLMGLSDNEWEFLKKKAEEIVGYSNEKEKS